MSDLKPEFTTFNTDVHPQANDKQAYVEGMFDAVAPTYDLANRLMSFGLDVLWRRRLVREAGLAPGARVLDVGCGTGDLILDFAARVRDLKGEGIDLSAGMLAVAKRKDRQGMVWTQGSALDLPQAPDGYDAVVSAWVLRSITDPQRFFSEMARVAKPGAKVLVLELTQPRMAWARAVYWPLLNLYVPFMGHLLSGHNDGYRYLRDSIKGFYKDDKVLGFMGKAGLKDLQALQLTFGVATLFVGTKA